MAHSSPLPTTTDSEYDETEALHRFPFFTVYKDGRIQHLPSGAAAETIPPSADAAAAAAGVLSKDVIISADPLITVRLFLPASAAAAKLPVLFYIHGGAFCMGSASSPPYHALLSSMVLSGGLIAAAVDYGLFPRRPIPACYDDSWTAFLWLAAHSGGDHGGDPWLTCHADFSRVVLMGDSAGANICHTVAVRAAAAAEEEQFPAVGVVGMGLVHPFFGGTEHDQMWLYMCPENEGLSDPRLRAAAPEMARLPCRRVVVVVAEKDHLRGVGIRYYDELRKSGWRGKAELVENKGEDHCFHLFDLSREESVGLIRRLVSFVVND